MQPIVSYDCVAIIIWIGPEVLKIERALQDVVLVWDQTLSHGSVESILNLAWHKLNTLQHVHLVAKQYAFARCCRFI